MDTLQHPDAVTHTTEIVAAYVAHNSVPAADLPGLIGAVYSALSNLGKPEVVIAATVARTPAVPVKKSVTDDFIVCLEDGRKFKSLKRHLATSYNLTPEEYRTKWGLDKDYPMVAPSYAAKRSELAKNIGLGRKAVANGMPA